eukprot:TRINITY_DN12385_c0_g1_i1.p1 TRINITY_DN12385_c0_g1~~TRINITY_DN12385_c0_g1_i1.p1  ORF type:complete len:657 (+),score=107.89 TRINITY_DN12385_c0_g1_i1:136-2106(+)
MMPGGSWVCFLGILFCVFATAAESTAADTAATRGHNARQSAVAELRRLRRLERELRISGSAAAMRRARSRQRLSGFERASSSSVDLPARWRSPLSRLSSETSWQDDAEGDFSGLGQGSTGLSDSSATSDGQTAFDSRRARNRHRSVGLGELLQEPLPRKTRRRMFRREDAGYVAGDAAGSGDFVEKESNVVREEREMDAMSANSQAIARAVPESMEADLAEREKHAAATANAPPEVMAREVAALRQRQADEAEKLAATSKSPPIAKAKITPTSAPPSPPSAQVSAGFGVAKENAHRVMAFGSIDDPVAGEMTTPELPAWEDGSRASSEKNDGSLTRVASLGTKEARASSGVSLSSGMQSISSNSSVAALMEGVHVGTENSSALSADLRGFASAAEKEAMQEAEELSTQVHISTDTNSNSAVATDMKDMKLSMLLKTEAIRSACFLKCLEYNPTTDELYIGTCHRGPNQRWKLAEETITNDDDQIGRSCVDFNDWRKHAPVASAEIGSPGQPFGFVAYSWKDCRARCFVTRECKQAVFEKATKICQLWKIALREDQDNLGGKNIEYISTHCQEDNGNKKCLEYSVDTREAKMVDCVSGRTNQKWYYADHQVLSRRDNGCLAVIHQGEYGKADNKPWNKVGVTTRCDKSDSNQRWHWA